MPRNRYPIASSGSLSMAASDMLAASFILPRFSSRSASYLGFRDEEPANGFATDPVESCALSEDDASAKGSLDAATGAAAGGSLDAASRGEEAEAGRISAAGVIGAYRADVIGLACEAAW